jgi:hypothetical protein
MQKHNIPVVDPQTTDVFNSKINQRFCKKNKEKQIKRQPVNIRIEKYIVTDFPNQQNPKNKQ